LWTGSGLGGNLSSSGILFIGLFLPFHRGWTNKCFIHALLTTLVFSAICAPSLGLQVSVSCNKVSFCQFCVYSEIFSA